MYYYNKNNIDIYNDIFVETYSLIKIMKYNIKF